MAKYGKSNWAIGSHCHRALINRCSPLLASVPMDLYVWWVWKKDFSAMIDWPKGLCTISMYLPTSLPTYHPTYLPTSLPTCVLTLCICLFQNDSIEPAAFTFEKFYKIYKTLCPRTDIDELFQQMWVFCLKKNYYSAPIFAKNVQNFGVKLLS